MKKRSLALLLAAAMVTGLTACGGGGSETTAAETTKAAAAETTAAPAEGEKSDAPAEGEKSDAPAADGEEITLTVWHIAIDETRHQTVTNAMNRFMEKYPNVKVVDVPNENDPYKTKLATAMAAGEEPDILVSLVGGWLESFIDY